MQFYDTLTLLIHTHLNPIQAHLNALQAIPRNLQLMYLHAFQSEVWNKAATHRSVYVSYIHVYI